MTSPALLVLFLAHVCSIFGTASEQAADHDNKLTNTHTAMTPYHGSDNAHPNLRTNIYNLDESNNELYTNKYIDIYREQSEFASNIGKRRRDVRVSNDKRLLRMIDESAMVAKRRDKRDDTACETFLFNAKDSSHIMDPHHKDNKTYYRDVNCVTVIEAPSPDQVIRLTFVDKFHIEYHPDCAYDYLEIRDGLMGYSKLLGRFCGTAFPGQITTSGPYAWLKFHSDETIEYEGFKITIDIMDTIKNRKSYSVPEACYIQLSGTHGDIDLHNVTQDCTKSTDWDILWTIRTAPNTKIYLNFTYFKLAKPNECELNEVDVFGSVTEVDHRLVQYCGSIANPVSTKGNDGKDGTTDEGNVMNLRIFVSSQSKNDTIFKATYTAYKTLNPNKDEKCQPNEFDCEDNTCIDKSLKCNDIANCRLKTDEDDDHCAKETTSTITQPHILVILVIFSLILSAMSFVFLFNCIRKLYQDHKIIKEHIRQSCEDRLDSLVSNRLILDAKRLQRDSGPRASLERENHTNEMFKRKRESFSKRKPTSIDSDYIQETHLDLDEEPWRREVDSVPIEPEDIRIERNGRTRRNDKDRRSERARESERRSDMSKKEESIRSKRESNEKEREKREIRDASVGAPDTKESGCQTRESLFQADMPPSSDGSGSNSRGFSTFGYSGATIVRPSSPATTNAPEMTIELLRQVPKQDTLKSQKKIPDRRPMSTETTRSAPDVIIVSKPIR